TQDGDGSGGKVIVSVGNRAADDRGHAERAVVIAGNDLAAHHFRLPVRVEVQLHRRESKYVRDCAFLLAQSGQRLHRERCTGRQTGRAIAPVAAVEATWSKLLAVPGRLEQHELVRILDRQL